MPAAWSVPWVLGVALAWDRRPCEGIAAPQGRHSDEGTTASQSRRSPEGTTAPQDGHPPEGTTASQGRHPPEGTAPGEHRRGRCRSGAALLIAGVAGMVVLVRGLGYPAAAVGVPGDGRSNLDPPSLFAVALAAAQIGAFRVLSDRRRTPNGGFVRAVNRAALPIYLSHQSVLVVAAAIGGNTLVRPPDDALWMMLRAAWLPPLALALAALTAPRWWATRRARGD